MKQFIYPTNRSYADKPKVIVPKNGTELRCQYCDHDKFGEFKDGVLEIRYKQRIVNANGGLIEIECRRCLIFNMIDLREIGTEVKIYLQNVE
jgi:hypothetical protein